MAGSKARFTFKKVRLSLFIRSYTFYRIAQGIREKYKFESKLKPKELRTKYFKKKSSPEISRLSRTLNLPYKPLWEAIVLDKTLSFAKKIPDKDRIRIYLSIEHELIQLAVMKQNRTDYTNPDYDFEFKILNLAIERAVGNRLINIKNDNVFERQSEILQKTYHNWYYAIAWKYKLPTTRIVPFVSRLIS